MDEIELERRRPVWTALSNLFLDTEVRPLVVNAAAACLSSGYSDEQLQTIWRHEVSPVLGWRLLGFGVGWEWVRFDQDGLESEILKRRPKWTDRIAARLNRKVWVEVSRLRMWLASWPTSDREAIVRALTTLTHGVYEETSYVPEHATNVTTEVLDKIWEEGAVPLIKALYVQSDEAPLEDFLERGREVLQKMKKR